MPSGSELGSRRSVLNVGAGPRRPDSTNPGFCPPGWVEVRLDLNPEVEPDVVGSTTDLSAHFGPATFDAVWSSHNLEHLFDHEVDRALTEMHRVLKPSGFALVTCPDLEAAAEQLLQRGLDGKVYVSEAGPIAVLDIFFGHGASIAAGNHFMAHRTGFTQQRLGVKATQAGFRQVRVGRGEALDLWAILPMPECDLDLVRSLVDDSRLAFLLEPGEAG